MGARQMPVGVGSTIRYDQSEDTREEKISKGRLMIREGMLSRGGII